MRRAKLLANLVRLRLFSGDERTRADSGIQLLRRAARLLLPGYRITEYGKSWFADEDFFRRLREVEDTDWASDRKFFLKELLKLARDVEGDTAEAGVFEAASSVFICQELAGSGKTHFAFDSFEGLSALTAADGSYWRAGDLQAPEQLARSRLEPFGAVVEKGWMPDVFAAAENRRFCFVHVDVDLYEPTLDSLRFFYPRLNPGGMLVCDDYGFESCPGARRAVDEFMAGRPEAVVHAPTGQCFLIKR